MSMILAFLLTTATTALAQTPAEIGGVSSETGRPETVTVDLDAACSELDDGLTVQLALADDTTVTGRFAGWDGDRLYLLRNNKRAGFHGRDVLALWSRQRATGAGLLAGAVLGSVGGGAFGGLMAYVIDTQHDDGAPYLPIVVGSMLAGGLGGGLIGAGVGSALPNWDLVYAAPGAPLERPEPDLIHRGGGSAIGSVSLMAGAAGNMGVANTHSDFAWRLSLLANADRRFSYGVEVGRYMAGNAHRPGAPWPEPDDSVPVWHGGGVTHLDVMTGPIRPFISGGLAYYNWNDSFLGYNLGAGLKLSLGQGIDWISEYRYHSNIQRLTETEPQMSTILAGVSFAW